jgi:hypothetical protein
MRGKDIFKPSQRWFVLRYIWGRQGGRGKRDGAAGGGNRRLSPALARECTALRLIETATEVPQSGGQEHWAAYYQAQLPRAQAIRDRLKRQRGDRDTVNGEAGTTGGASASMKEYGYGQATLLDRRRPLRRRRLALHNRGRSRQTQKPIPFNMSESSH